MPVEYHTMNVWQLLLELWLMYEEIQNLRELIPIGFQQTYITQRRALYERFDEISIHIKNVWPSILPPFLPLRLRYQNLKQAYNPNRHSRYGYFRLLHRKRHFLIRHQRLIYNYTRKNNDIARRACLR